MRYRKYYSFLLFLGKVIYSLTTHLEVEVVVLHPVPYKLVGVVVEVELYSVWILHNTKAYI